MTVNDMLSSLSSLSKSMSISYDYLSEPMADLTISFSDLARLCEEFNSSQGFSDLTKVYEKLDSGKEENQSIKRKEKEEMFDFGNMFNGMFKPVAKGYCKMGMNGQVAVKTSTGYKTFNIKTKKLTNCSNFAFDMDGAFWVVPTFKVEIGDIVLVNGKPRCVIEVGANSIKTFSYEDSTIDEVIPEHHVFMGKTYCYGKIFSPFMNMSKSDGAMDSMMKMMMMSQMFGGNAGAGMNGMNPMMFMMMGKDNPFEDMFDGAFDFGFGTADAVEDEEEE